MYLLQTAQQFNWKQLLLGNEAWGFLPEVLLRSFVMFIIILTSLLILGKRGVKQLSIFELVVIIGLGSAAGDPMFYKDVGILPAIVVCTVVVGLYSLITYFVGINKKFEKLIEGVPVCLIKEGVFSIENFKKEILSEHEFFAELRMQGVSQLGQIEEAIEEVSGNISIFFYPDEDVKDGLPIMPDSLDKSQQKISSTGNYSCTFCGYTTKLEPTARINCPNCKRCEWVKASNRKRVT